MVAPEVPDWTRPVSVMGKDSEGNPVTVLLDPLGRLICVLYGAITLSGPVDVTQVDSTREIQGADGVTLHTIAVDSEGRIIAIVKGEYAGTLKNLAVDSEGRMIMIPTDPADIWGNAISMGNAELAAVLSPAKRFDRRGNVIDIETFANGRACWEETLAGTGSEVNISTTRALSPPYSLRLVTGSDGAKAVKVLYRIPYHTPSKFGLEYAFTHHADLLYHIFHFYYRDGTTQYEYLVELDVVNGRLLARTPGPAWTEFASGLNLQSNYQLFHIGKLVSDAVNNKYVRFLLDDEEYNLSAYTPYSFAYSSVPYLEVAIQMNANTAANLATYIDNVIFTQNEPA